MNINSKEYWNHRFETDWNAYGGNMQTTFFSNLACDMIPDWLKRKSKIKQYSICDVGCALGEAVDVLSKNLDIKNVMGIDFSEDAIKKAKDKFPQYKFIVKDITKDITDIKVDVAFCSNVLEHFLQPWEIVEQLAKIAQHYIIILIPFKEVLEIKEHVYQFEEDKIPMALASFQLIYVDTVDASKRSDTYYPGQQALLIYSSQEEDKKAWNLSDLSRGIVKSEVCEKWDKLQEDYEKQKQICMDYELEQKELKQKLNQIEENRNQLEKNLKEKEEELKKKEEEKKQLKLENEELKKLYKEKEEVIHKALMQCNYMLSSKLFKLVHLCNRSIYQGIKGEKTERRQFRKWILEHNHTGGDTDRRYNPLFSIIYILEEKNKNVFWEVDGQNENSADVKHTKRKQEIYKKRNLMLNKKYDKYDVIILGVIDYDFRYQRPQHFASSFAENGHRVFYVNANHDKESSIVKLKKNLYIVTLKNTDYSAIHLTDWRDKKEKLKMLLDHVMRECCIRDAITIVDYPNWAYAAEYLRHQYGFKIITDYMDDFTGFLNPAEQLVSKNCKKLLSASDMIIPSSQFLYEIAKKYNSDIEIVRNGTEFEHFYQAYQKEDHKACKVVGYYGAVAEWFDCDKVCYLAEHLPTTDIVIIGNVTAGRNKLSKYENIKLLGEIPYQDLPQHLKDFDVALIPFDTSTDLIKATNPVKFYEYLSAGKKIVATEIPELEAYRNEYVYMANDKESFLEYVKLCLCGQDTLQDSQACIAFAKENDWQMRYETFAKLCEKVVPSVSIIVLTYNNLKLNQICIDSILEKTAYSNYELIIVDNLSTDGTREYLSELEKKAIPQVRVVLNEENKGFAGGNNVGMRMAKGDYVVLLNNDTIVTRGWLTGMVKHLENDKKLGMCGPVTNSIGNEAKVEVTYRNREELEPFSYQYITKHENQLFADPKVLALFCTMIKKEVIEECGLLDEGYEVGMFEDDDYAEAVKQAGYHLAIAEDVFIHHFEGASFKKLEDIKYKAIFEKNKKRFEEKWNTKWIMHQYRSNIAWDTNKDVFIV